MSRDYENLVRQVKGITKKKYEVSGNLNRENKNLIGQVRGGHDQTGGEVMVVGIIPSHLFQSETSDVEMRLEKTMTKMKEWSQGSGKNEEIG